MDVLVFALVLLTAAGLYRLTHRTASAALPHLPGSRFSTVDRDLPRQQSDLAAIAAHTQG